VRGLYWGAHLVLQRCQVLKEKVAAAAFAKNYMSGIESSVLDRLSKMAYFFDPVEREVETDFMPWLGSLALEKLEKVELASTLASEAVAQSIAQGEQAYTDMLRAKEEAEAAAEIAAAEAEEAAADGA
jgi:hypothetical protein